MKNRHIDISESCHFVNRMSALEFFETYICIRNIHMFNLWQRAIALDKYNGTHKYMLQHKALSCMV